MKIYTVRTTVLLLIGMGLLKDKININLQMVRQVSTFNLSCNVFWRDSSYIVLNSVNCDMLALKTAEVKRVHREAIKMFYKIVALLV
jgi:hypothetical protein